MGGGTPDREREYGLWREPEFRYIKDGGHIVSDPYSETKTELKGVSAESIAEMKGSDLITKNTTKMIQSIGSKTESVKTESAKTESAKAVDGSTEAGESESQDAISDSVKAVVTNLK